MGKHSRYKSRKRPHGSSREGFFDSDSSYGDKPTRNKRAREKSPVHRRHSSSTRSRSSDRSSSNALEGKLDTVLTLLTHLSKAHIDRQEAPSSEPNLNSGPTVQNRDPLYGEREDANLVVVSEGKPELAYIRSYILSMS